MSCGHVPLRYRVRGCKGILPLLSSSCGAAQAATVTCFILKTLLLGRDFSCFMDEKMSLERSWSCMFGPKMKLSREWSPRQASSLSLSLPAGRSPSGAVDRHAGCPAEPARLVPWPPGLRSCAPGPALLPEGMESVGQGWEDLGSVL